MPRASIATSAASFAANGGIGSSRDASNTTDAAVRKLSSAMTVSPLALVQHEGRWHLLAYDELRDGERTFLLQRIVSSVRMLQSAARSMKSGDAERALSIFQQLAEMAPAHPEVAAGLVRSLVALGRIDDAIRAYQSALALDPDNADAHFNLAGIYERRGEKQAALRHLKMYRALSA